MKCLITLKELEELWDRDNAGKMEWPSIDRIDSGGHYEKSNCRFIEQRVNSSLKKKNKLSDYIGINLEPSRLRRRRWRGSRYRDGKDIRTRWCLTEKEAIAEYKKILGVEPMKLSEHNHCGVQ